MSRSRFVLLALVMLTLTLVATPGFAEGTDVIRYLGPQSCETSQHPGFQIQVIIPGQEYVLQFLGTAYPELLNEELRVLMAERGVLAKTYALSTWAMVVDGEPKLGWIIRTEPINTVSKELSEVKEGDFVYVHSGWSVLVDGKDGRLMMQRLNPADGYDDCPLDANHMGLVMDVVRKGDPRWPIVP